MTLCRRQFQQLGRKATIMAAALVVSLGASSCGNSVPDAPVAPSDRPAAELVADAEQLYAQRGEVLKVRQGLIILREVLAANPAN